MKKLQKHLIGCFKNALTGEGPTIPEGLMKAVWLTEHKKCPNNQKFENQNLRVSCILGSAWESVSNISIAISNLNTAPFEIEQMTLTPLWWLEDQVIPLLLLANSQQSFSSCTLNGTCLSSNLFPKLAPSPLIIKFVWEKEKHNNPFFQLKFHFQLIVHFFCLFPFWLRIVDMYYRSTVLSTMLTCKKL